jgi:tetratricopeptide (TPR) repeat protein
VPSIAEICDGLPDELDPVFRRAMAKDPGARYPTAQDFVAAARGALAEAAGTTRSLRPVAAAPLPARAERPSRPPSPHARPRRAGGWAILFALLALGAIAGAIAAILLTNDNGGQGAKGQVKTVVARTTVQGRTVRQTVTGSTTAAAATNPPAAPPPRPASSSASGVSLNNAGYTKMRAGDYTGALPLLRQAVQKLSGTGVADEAYANYNLGYTLLQLGRCAEALGYLQTAQQLEPDRHEPQDAAKQAQHCAKGKGDKQGR